MSTTDTKRFNCAVVTMSDKGAAGLREDTSGPALQTILQKEGYEVKEYRIVPDQREKIAETVNLLVDHHEINLIVTTGGTGVAPTDVTPEAMDLVFEREVPGMAEAMRASSLKVTPYSVISRGRVGIRKKSLIINLPGSEKGAIENIEVLLKALPHALAKIQGDPEDCGG